MTAGPARATSRAGIAGWILFDAAAQPVFTLVTTFVFAPFFASRLAATPAEGQALWGFTAAVAGLTIAVLSPVLGSIADAGGRRKPWIAAFSVPLVLGCAALWWAVPGESQAVALALAAFAVATIGAECATAFTNAMMPGLVPPGRLGRLSGAGWAAGYAGGLAALALMLAFFAANPGTGRTLAGLTPVFGLDPATGEGDRASGPFSAIWYAVLVLPLFLFTPDSPRRSGIGQAVGEGLRDLKRTLAALPGHRDAALYLLAHMIYADGLAALFAFAGIYAAGTFGWGTIEIGSFGILLTVTGIAGAWLGGRLDDRFGPKRVVLAALTVLILASLGILSLDRDRALFVIALEPGAATGLFGGAAETIFVGLGAAIGAAAGPLQAASRTLMARLAPEGHVTQFFGLYALSGKVTSFMGPLLIGAVTAWTLSQKSGMAVLLLFFLGGMALLARVRVPARA